jgi:RNA-directed DNA polymerase
MGFTPLAHLMDVDLLREADRRTRKDAAPGIDGVTAASYAEPLEANLTDLYERLRGGRDTASPVKRTWLDKEDGSQRPIGMPAVADKIVQRAVTMLLGAVYEQDFHDCSHGFREGHSPHQALHELREQCLEQNIGWIVDADVSGCFDSLDHGLLRDVIRKRVNDGGLLRLIGKWLNAGVLDGEDLTYPEKGTPQGGVLSPMLANIFLHEVLDAWVERDVRPRMRGRTFLSRFADDFVIGCEREDDARRVMAVLPKRFARFGLTIHPQKTRLVDFRKPARRGEAGIGNGTCEFLGFTHYWMKSRRGYWVIKRRTASKRLRRTMRALWQWCRDQRHTPLTAQYRTLCQKLRGHYQYYGIRGNYPRLERLYEHAGHAWRYWLSRRSHQSAIPWERFDRLHVRFPRPAPRIVHAI